MYVTVRVGIAALIGFASALAQETTSTSSVSTFTTFTSWISASTTTTSTSPTAEPTHWEKKCGADICNSKSQAKV